MPLDNFALTRILDKRVAQIWTKGNLFFQCQGAKRVDPLTRFIDTTNHLVQHSELQERLGLEQCFGSGDLDRGCLLSVSS